VFPPSGQAKYAAASQSGRGGQRGPTTAAAGDTGFPECDEGALVSAARAAGEDVNAGLELAERYGACLPPPGGGATAQRWRLLAAVAAEDLTVARILEAHSDALAILVEAGESRPAGRWGVFAAEASDVALIARNGNGGWTVVGTKPWCSLGGRLDFALVTASVGSARRLFAVDLHHHSVQAEPPSRWVARGLRAIPSGPVHFAGTPARPIGDPDWYLTRPGFAWGGIGVAACWYGGARALADRLQSSATQRPGDLVSLSVGTVDVALHAAWTCLMDAARCVDTHSDDRQRGLLALRVRSVVVAAAERVLCQVGHTLGPAPLAFDETHARRVADLEIYLRQHHAERDLAALGHRLIDEHPR
jgi:alkylation response protein AidB-like acyl-CoA dehydrogenase